MTMQRLFYAYMALAGIAAGAVLAAVPQAQDFFIKPYFWVLIAVGLFDVGAYLRGGNAPGAMLSMNARVIGFLIGGLLMVAIPTLTGVEVRFF